jgi:hypothetical protein
MQVGPSEELAVVEMSTESGYASVTRLYLRAYFSLPAWLVRYTANMPSQWSPSQCSPVTVGSAVARWLAAATSNAGTLAALSNSDL